MSTTQSPFSATEIERRQEEMRGHLSTGQAFVAFSFTGSFYFSGAPIVHWGRPAITVVPKSDTAFMISSVMEAPRIESLGHVGDMTVYQDSDGPSLKTALGHLVAELSARGIEGISFDGGMTPYATVELLRERCPNILLADGTSRLDSMRLILSDEEIEHVRAAVAISDVGVEAFLEDARLGQAESTLAARSSQAMADFTARHYPDLETHLRCYSQQGLRTLEPHSGTGGQPLTAGSLLQLVVEASAWHYLSAVERTIALGNLPAEHDAYFNTLVEAHETAIAAVVPGAPRSAPHEAASKIFARDGYGKSPVGTGLQRGVVSEWEGRIPEGDLRTYNDAPFESDMVISVEPFTHVESVGATRHCDMVLVTRTGNERLSQSPAGRLNIAS